MVSLELAYDPKIDSIEVGTGFSHIVAQVDNLDSKLADLAEKGVGFDVPQRPAREWPPGHSDGITRADFL